MIFMAKKKKSFMKKYKEAIEFSGLKVKPAMMIMLILIVSVGALVLGFLLADITISFLIILLVTDLGLGLPFFLADRKVAQI